MPIALLQDAAATAAIATTPWQWIAIAFAVLGEVLAVVFVYRVLVSGGSPATTLLWMVVILAVPWLGLLLYYLLPRQLELRKLRKVRGRGRRMREARPKAPPRAPADVGEAPPAAGLQALLDGADGSGLDTGNAMQWLASGEEFAAAAHAAIVAAQHHVHCIIYILRPDAAGLRFLAQLTEAARRGAEVRLLFDSFGSFGLRAAHLAPLRAAGGRAEAFLPLFWKRRPFTVNLRNHRKLLLVDGEIAFVGGRNIAEEYLTDRIGRQRRWLDAMVAIRGPAVARLHEVFVEDWCTATDEELPGPQLQSAPPAPGREAVGVVCSGPDREESDLWFAVIQAIAEAVHTIDVSSPYLVPSPTLLFMLQLAAARGVRVSIHTNGPKTEAAVLYFAQRRFYAPLLQAGVEIYESGDDYNHAKLLVVDRRIVVVGSANMDLRSAHLNFEIAVVMPDAPDLAGQVLATMAQRQQRFRRIGERDLPRHPFVRLVDGFCGLLSPLL